MFARLYVMPSDQALIQALADQVAADAAAAQAAAAGAVAVTGLSAIGAESRAIALRSGATAAFIYDTRLDSDGGAAMRFKTQDRSGYQELGQFPQRTLWAVFGTSTTKVMVVFNLDDPKCPVYMLFSGASNNGMFYAGDTTVNGIYCRDGHVVWAGSSGGLSWIDLIGDVQNRGSFSVNKVAGPISNRNTTNAAHRLAGGSFVGATASNTTYAVSLAVLPGTPGNPSRCNLPDPLILVSTASGMSVVMLDGSTVRSASSATINYGHVVSDGLVFQIVSLADPILRVSRLVDTLQASWSTGTEASLTSSSTPFALYGAAAAKIAARPFGFSTSRDKGVVHAIWDRIRPERSLLCRQQSNVITGFMCGASDFALQANSAYTGAAAAGTNLITNGDFGTGDLTGWTTNVAGASTVTNVSNAMQLVRAAGATCRGYQSFSTTVGKAYTLYVTVTGSVGIWIGSTSEASDVALFAATAARRVHFIATSTTTYLTFSASTDATHTVDDVNCREAIADFSKSPQIASTVPRTNDFDIAGSLNRTAIQSGCDVYGFSGFSTSNYLRSINALAGPGTGDFHMQAVFSGAASGAIQTIFEWADSPYSGAGIRLYLSTAGALVGQVTANGFAASTTVTSPQDDYGDGFPHTVALIRSGGYLQLWVDGRRVISAASSETLTNGSAIFVIGVNALVTTSAATAITIGMMRANMIAAPDQSILPLAMREELEILRANVASLLPTGTVQDISSDAMTGALVVSTTTGACVLRGLAKTASYTSQTAVNKFPNPSFPKTSPTATLPDEITISATSGITISHIGSGTDANGEGYADFRLSGTPGATGTSSIYLGPRLNVAALNGEQWFLNLDAALVGGAMTNISSIVARLVSISSGNTALTSLTSMSLAAITSTLTRQAGVAATHSHASTAFTAPRIDVGVTNGLAIDITIRISRVFMAQGSSEPADYAPGFSNSANALLAVMNDNDVFIATAKGLDAIVAAQPMRSNLMREVQRRIAPQTFKCQTTGATATRAWQFPVLEGQSFMVEAELSARQVGGVITEYARYRLRAICKRDFGGNVVVQNVTTTDYEVTSSMDAAFTADTTNQTIYLSVTGKATTNLVWVGEPKITLLNPQLAA